MALLTLTEQNPLVLLLLRPTRLLSDRFSDLTRFWLPDSCETYSLRILCMNNTSAPLTPPFSLFPITAAYRHRSDRHACVPAWPREMRSVSQTTRVIP